MIELDKGIKFETYFEIEICKNRVQFKLSPNNLGSLFVINTPQSNKVLCHNECLSRLRCLHGALILCLLFQRSILKWAREPQGEPLSSLSILSMYSNPKSLIVFVKASTFRRCHCQLRLLHVPPDPMNHAKMFKGWSPRDAPS